MEVKLSTLFSNFNGVNHYYSDMDNGGYLISTNPLPVPGIFSVKEKKAYCGKIDISNLLLAYSTDNGEILSSRLMCDSINFEDTLEIWNSKINDLCLLSRIYPDLRFPIFPLSMHRSIYDSLKDFITANVS